VKYPNEREALGLLEKYRCPKDVVIHCLTVRQVATKMARRINDNGHELDPELVKSAALLHDIGRCGYAKEKGWSFDFHEYYTGKILRELGYEEFAAICEAHPLGGLTTEETKALGFPEAVDLMPKHLVSKIICVADKIRPDEGRTTLGDTIKTYDTSERLNERYFKKLPGLKEKSVERVKKLWSEMKKMGADI